MSRVRKNSKILIEIFYVCVCRFVLYFLWNIYDFYLRIWWNRSNLVCEKVYMTRTWMTLLEELSWICLFFWIFSIIFTWAYIFKSMDIVDGVKSLPFVESTFTWEYVYIYIYRYCCFFYWLYLWVVYLLVRAENLRTWMTFCFPLDVCWLLLVGSSFCVCVVFGL